MYQRTADFVNRTVAAYVAKEIGKDKKIVLIAPDGGEKYISMGLYD